ncbi:MAG TPA: DUF4296 domain-containing protein [Cyclobacteriaceae bacterium]
MSILEPFLMYTTVILTKGDKVSLEPLKLIFVLIVLLVFGCGSQEKPKGLLSQNEMVSLMVDVYLAEARIAAKGIPRDSASKLFEPYESALIAKRGFSDSVLHANYAYYLQKPDELEKILDAVIDTLNLREQRLPKP